MSASVIYADFKSKTYHKPESLEEMAIALTEQFNRMAEEGTEVTCEMDTAPSEYVAPPTDCA